MNREIKFRAWCDFDTIEESHKIGMVYFSHLELDNGLWFNPDDKSVYHINEWLSKPMQFTGLHDKNGREVFEGDILRFPFELGIAYVINDGFRFAVKSPGSEAIDYESPETLQQCEIIGNFHEHPELLTQ